MNIFLLFIFGIMEFGHFVMVKQLMDNAARDGARMASTGTLTVTTAQIQALVTTELSNQGPSNLTIQVFQADPTTGANIGAWTNAGLGDAVAVKITGNYQPMVNIGLALAGRRSPSRRKPWSIASRRTDSEHLRCGTCRRIFQFSRTTQRFQSGAGRRCSTSRSKACCLCQGTMS